MSYNLQFGGCFTVSTRSMASKTQVGFVGLGNMGNPMAKNLLKHGYPVIATDVFPESCKEVQELGAQVVMLNVHTSFCLKKKNVCNTFFCFVYVPVCFWGLYSSDCG